MVCSLQVHWGSRRWVFYAYVVCVCVCVCVCGSNSGNYKLTVVERVEDKNRDHGIQIRICKGYVAIVAGNGMIIIIIIRIRKSSSPSYLPVYS